MLYKILVKDNREPFKEIQTNDLAKLNHKSEWRKFIVKNLYEWYKHGQIEQESNRKSKKVTDLKTKELDENAMERKCTQIVDVNFWQQQYFSFIFHSFLLSFK